MSADTPIPDALFRLAGVGVVQTDLASGRFVRVNAAFCEMVGYAEAELSGMTNAELTHPDDWAQDAVTFGAMQQGNVRAVQALTRVLHQDGSVRWLELSVTVLGEGDTAVNLAVVSDVTRRVEAEAALKDLNETLEGRIEDRTQQLQHSEQRFSQAFFSNPIPACMTTFGRETFVEVNEAFLALTGYERGEVVARTAFELGMWSSPDDRRKLDEAQRDARGFHNLELQLRHREGHTYDILLSAAVIRLDGHEGYLKMFYDVTERKQTEEELLEAVQEVMRDASWFGSQLLERLANIRAGAKGEAEVVELSKRERQVLERMAKGLNNDTIAAELGIAAQTVRNYISNLYDKLGVHTRAEAVVWARERGIIGP